MEVAVRTKADKAARPPVPSVSGPARFCHNCGTKVLGAPEAKDDDDSNDSSCSTPGNEFSESCSNDKPVRTRIGRITTNAKGDRTMIDEADWKAPPDATQNGKFDLVIRTQREWGQNGLLKDAESLVIVAPELVRAYKTSVPYFPGIQVEDQLVSMDEPYAPLFWHYDDISKAAANQGPAADGPMKVLEQFYLRSLSKRFQRARSMAADGNVLFDDMWALFRPGELVFARDDLEEPCLYIAIAARYRRRETYPAGPNNVYSIQRYKRLSLDMWSVNWQPSTRLFQRRTVTRSIKAFSGSCRIGSLPFYPLQYYEGGDAEKIAELKEAMSKRGKKWKDLVSSPGSCKHYEGPAMVPITVSDRSMRRTGMPVWSEDHIDERVIIDPELASLIAPEQRVPAPLGGMYEQKRIEYELPVLGYDNDEKFAHFDDFPSDKDFDDVQARLCPSSVLSYGLKSRCLYTIKVSLIQDIEWAKTAVDDLVLEQRVKRILLGLVEKHRTNRDESLRDVIPSKGKGLVVVLHGSPGVGKTLTAEAIAEYTQKPLYPINVGELTNTVDTVGVLETHFARASKWDALLLLDEADVILERRSFEDIKRNGIVSAFLRMLEYYEGILFLTTNRLLTMDSAFQSRIHIAIRYPDLDPPMRRRIWETFIGRLDGREREGKRELLARLDDLQAWELNGRQIRNVLMTAEALSLSIHRRRGALRYRDIEDMANETISFQDLFEGSHKERKAQIGDIGGREFQERRVGQWKDVGINRFP